MDRKLSVRLINIHVMYGGTDFRPQESFFPSKNGEVEVCNVFVQNSSDAGFPSIPGSFHVTGTNRLREFSGWQEGIDFLTNHDLLSDEDLLMLSNDSIFREKRLLPIVSAGFESIGLSPLKANEVLAPVVYDQYDIKIFGRHLTKLMATYFIAMRWADLKKIGGICGDVEFSRCLSSCYEEGQLFCVPGANRYNEYYNRWLGSSKNEVGRWWASREIPFTAKNYHFLREKAKMILLESDLTSRILINRFLVRDLYQTSNFAVAKKRVKRLLSILRNKN